VSHRIADLVKDHVSHLVNQPCLPLFEKG